MQVRHCLKMNLCNLICLNLTDNRLDDLYDEMEILGFTLSNPFEMVDDDPDKYVLAKDLAAAIMVK